MSLVSSIEISIASSSEDDVLTLKSIGNDVLAAIATLFSCPGVDALTRGGRRTFFVTFATDPTWIADIGFGYTSVGPLPPTKCLEQINVF